MGRCSWPSGGTSLDIKAKVSAADTTTDYLDSKIVVGAGLTKTILNPGANEQIQLVNTGSGPGDKYDWLPAQDATPVMGSSTFITRTYAFDRKAYLWDLDPGDSILWTYAPDERWTLGSIFVKVYWQSLDASHGTPHTIRLVCGEWGDHEDLTLGWSNQKNYFDTENSSNELCISDWFELVNAANSGQWRAGGSAIVQDLWFLHLEHGDGGACAASGPIQILGVKLRYPRT
jgi:hypothetical protein